MADAVDLVTNTTGTLLGIGAAVAFPHLFPTSNELEATADRARPVDKGRRWLGQLLDGVYYLASLAVAGFGLALLLRAAGVSSREDPGPLWAAVMVAADVLALVFAALSWTGDGSSMGQRTTYLRPALAPGELASRWRAPSW